MNQVDAPSQSGVHAASSSASDLRLHGGLLTLARGVWMAFVLTELVIAILSLVVTGTSELTVCPLTESCAITPATAQALHQVGIAPSTYVLGNVVLAVLEALVFLSVGGVIFWRKSSEPICLAASFVFVTIGLWLFFTKSPYPPAVAFSNVSALYVIPFIGYFLVTFPDGRFVPRWSSLLVVLWLVQVIVFEIPGPFNITSWPPPLPVVLLLLTYGGTIGVQIYRYMRVFSYSQRQQTKWLVFGLAGLIALNFLVGFIGSMLPGLGAPDSPYQQVSAVLTTLAFLIVPLTTGMAILRSRLWEIDVIIQRTLVFAALSACVIGLYVLIVVGLGSLLQTPGNLLLSLLATGLIAVLFQPLHQRVQQGVNRLLFGERNEPYRVLSRLGQRLEETLPAESFLPTIVETVAHALKLPYVAILWKREQGLLGAESPRLAAAFGTSSPRAAETRVPLVHQGELVGELVLAPRQRGEELTPADLRLVRDLAPQIGLALYSTALLTDLQQLTADLQRSRERLVTAREEERRRLRRDLHDGLGPQLSSQALTLSAIKKLLRQDPDTAEQLVNDATIHAQEAIADIRRLVYALRPPALDDLGMLAALEEQINQYHASGIVLTLEAPETLPPLPAAIEMACYRIVQEALTIVVRHAHATAAAVELRVQEELVVEVRDNGHGLPPVVQSGVGLRSMRERAEELGGTCLIETRASRGTRVYARLPLPVGHYEEHETVQQGEEVP
jgi:signal transduction histidine kinase